MLVHGDATCAPVWKRVAEGLVGRGARVCVIGRFFVFEISFGAISSRRVVEWRACQTDTGWMNDQRTVLEILIGLVATSQAGPSIIHQRQHIHITSH